MLNSYQTAETSVRQPERLTFTDIVIDPHSVVSPVLDEHRLYTGAVPPHTDAVIGALPGHCLSHTFSVGVMAVTRV
ncbi:MAG: hypothetical protein SAJ72_19920 [Jaaginema sp. PMC 1080.18]|nr:hypothetical protein [Jaaginema sp. PMC 1080.18]MEC4868177.1 hypothetical protein [Jaaginema sp. PMC 1078.18]